MNRPLAAITACFTVGILLNGWWGFVPVVLFTGLLVCAIAVLAGFFYAHVDNRYFLALLFVLLGWTAAGVDSMRNPADPVRFAGHYVSVYGMVDREPDVRLDYTGYVLKVDKVRFGEEYYKAQGLTLVRFYDPDRQYNFGDYLQVQGLLYAPETPGNFGALNYQDYLSRRGIYSLMRVTNAENMQYEHAGGSAPLRLALQGKEQLLAVSNKTLDARQAAVLSGMLFGNQGEIEQSVKDLFAQTGITHILSVSGLHVAFVLSGVLLLGNILRLSRLWLMITAVLVLVFYMVMTNMGPAVIRSVIMGLAALFALYLGRERDWPSALGIAALVVLAVDPSSLYEIGFQLSFVATWGILYLTPPINDWFRERLGLPNWLSITLGVTLGAQLATWPLVINYFNLVSFIAPLANLLLIPLVGLIMLLGFLGSVAGLIFLPVALLINTGTGLLIDIFIVAGSLLSGWPGGSFYVAAPHWGWIVLWYLCLIAWGELFIGGGALTPLIVRLRALNLGIAIADRMQWLSRHSLLYQVLEMFRNKADVRKTLMGLLVIIMMLITFWPWAGVGGELQVHFIDVGQGDSILIRFPGGRTMLVDTGGRAGDMEGSRAVGDLVVVPYLHRLGMNRVDVLAITHPDSDHAGGAPAVVEKLRVGALVLSQACDYDDVLGAIGAGNLPVYRMSAGQSLLLDEQVEVTVLAPLASWTEESSEDANDASLVLRLDYGTVSFLLTGDIGEETQKTLLENNTYLQADVLKVPHHGSKYFSAEFFAAADPEYAVIQVGKNNLYGHPAPETLSALSETGADILRCDTDGAVFISTDGEEINIYTAR